MVILKDFLEELRVKNVILQTKKNVLQFLVGASRAFQLGGLVPKAGPRTLDPRTCHLRPLHGAGRQPMIYTTLVRKAQTSMKFLSAFWSKPQNGADLCKITREASKLAIFGGEGGPTDFVDKPICGHLGFSETDLAKKLPDH